MKLKVYADRTGKILATFRPAPGGKDAPTNVRMEVDGGSEHEIDIPEHVVTPGSIHKLHEEYRVDLTGGSPRLIKARSPSGH
jgi:hypothetical protein